jgi:HK97 family phage prohead protease
MAEEARRGLEWRREYGRGGTEIGVARARDIANRKNLSEQTIGRMVSYFARHEVDKQGKGFSPGEDGYPSNGRIAWALWGGDPGKIWAEKEFAMIQENRAAPDALKVGDFVSWNSSGARARGRITRIERDGRLNVPGSSFSVTGTEDDPAALIRLYRDGESTDTIVGHKFSTLTRIDNINERNRKDGQMFTRKDISLLDAEIKLTKSGKNSFAGYASVFGGVDTYDDTIMKGAYREVIDQIQKGSARMPKMFVNHRSWDIPPGKWTKIEEDDRGLYMEGEFTPGNPQADVLKASLQHGTVDGLSIGFKVGDYEIIETEGEKLRLIKSVAELAEVSIVTFPADDAARVDLTSVKSSLDQINDIKDFEAFLRDAGGFSKSLAVATVGTAKRLLRSESGSKTVPEDLQAAILRNLLLTKTL